MTLETAWQRYKEFQDQTALEFLIQTYGHLVHYVLGLIHLPLGPMLQYEDAVSCGLLGLLDAFSKYDESRDCKFENYAIHRIRGEIRDGVRAVQWQPRSVQEKAAKLKQVWQDLCAQFGRPPTEIEMAKALGLNLDSYQEMVEEARSLVLISLDDIVFHDNDDGTILVEETIADTNNNDPTAFIEAEDLQQQLAQAIAALPEREKLAFTLRFYEELTVKEIGAVLGVSDGRVSQLLTQACGRLQRQLEANERLSELSLNQLQLPAEVIVVDLNRRRGGDKVAEVLKINDPQIKEAYYCLTRHARDKKGQLVVAEAGEILQYRKLDPYFITVLEKLGVMKRSGVDEWAIKAGVQFEMFEILQLPVDQEREEERMLSEMDKTLNVVSVDRELAQAYYTLRKQAFTDGPRLAVAYPAEILDEKGFSSELVERLVSEDLLVKPETDQYVVWELKEAAVVVEDAVAKLTAPAQTQPTTEEPTVAVLPAKISQEPEQQKVQEEKQEKREEARKVAGEVVVPSGSAIEKAHRLLVAAADENGQVVGANVILEKSGFVGYTTDLKGHGLIAPVVKEDGKVARVGKAVVWQVVGAQKAEEPAIVSAKPEAVAEKPKHRIVPKAKPVEKKKPEEALPKPQKMEKQIKTEKLAKPQRAVAKAPKKGAQSAIASGDENQLFQQMLFNGEGTLKSVSQLRAVAAWLTAMIEVPKATIKQWAAVATAAADNPTPFELFLKFAKHD